MTIAAERNAEDLTCLDHAEPWTSNRFTARYLLFGGESNPFGGIADLCLVYKALDGHEAVNIAIRWLDKNPQDWWQVVLVTDYGLSLVEQGP